MDETAEQVLSANIVRTDLDRSPGRCDRWGQGEGAMGPAAVVVLGVGPDGSIEMPPPWMSVQSRHSARIVSITRSA